MIVIKNQPISNIELQEIMTKYRIQCNGIVMKDQLLDLDEGGYIINLNDSHQSGSHWVALYCTRKEHIYFDSFGGPPPQDIHELLLSKYGKVNFNSFIIQDLKSQLCGYFCLGLLLYIKLHTRQFKTLVAKANDFCNYFYDDTKKNNAVLTKFLKTHLNY